MIYKFIDNNGSEITVNSLSSLQALVDSETVKKNTKVKAGLRGKWTTAESISDLVFEEKKEEQIPEETIEPEEDIKTFLTKEENKKKSKKKTTKKDKVKEIPQEDEDQEDEIEDIDVKEEEEKTDDEIEEEKTDYDIEEEKRDKTYDDENVIGLNFFQAIGACLRKYFTIKGRASRSEYWFLQLLTTPLYLILLATENSYSGNAIIFGAIAGIIVLLLVIPVLTVTVRRFHDINKSGWFILFNLIPFIGWIIVLVMLIEKGTEGKNRFGDYPLKLKRKQ